MGGTLRATTRFALTVILLGALLASCDEDTTPPPSETPKKTQPTPKLELVDTPVFNGDSAYEFVARQVAFGPRVPNTEAHKKCAQWLEEKLKSFGMEVNVQKASVTAFDGTELRIFNIMGQYNPEAINRILFCAHWDSRPFADRDTKDRTKPIDGANDGASGVGVLLEMARSIHADSLKPDIGFDVVFFDAEDYGKPESSMTGSGNNTWCLGSQHWSRNIPIPNYKPRYGILLDMVGAGKAVFPKESASLRFAPHVVNKVWKIARAMNYGDYFVSFQGNPITDDHIYLNQLAGIPTIDVIHYEMGRNDFGHFHHTHDDNMDGIDRGTLRVVGEVMMQTLYQEP